MLTAYISGRLGRALTFDGLNFFIEGPRMPRRDATAREVIQVSDPDAEYDLRSVHDFEDLSSQVADATSDADILFLLLSVINPQLSLSTRLLCAQTIEPLLSSGVRHRILQKLLSDPLPTEVRTESGPTGVYFASFEKLAGLVRILFESQDAIVTIQGAFQEAVHSLALQERKELHSELVHFDVFANLVNTFRVSGANEFNTAVVTSLLSVKSSELAANAASTITQMQRSLAGLLRRKHPKQQLLNLHSSEEARSYQRKRSEGIDDLLSSDPLISLSRLSNFEAKSNVDKQIAGIKQQILNGREDLVEKYLTELVRFQIGNSEKNQLAKSLCLLTGVALAANQLTMADQISLYTLQLQVDDQVIYTTRAEVLKHLGQFDASLQSYRDAKVRFPESSYAWNGEADVLKESGRFDEALLAYQTTRARFADDPVPHNGFVATLRRMGRLREAVKEAWRNVKRFRDDSVSRTELANVMSAAGRYRDAAINYKIVLDQNPKAVRALLSYVRTLNFLGDHHQALTLLLKTAQRDKGPVVLNALAIQYRVMGKLGEALDVSRQITLTFPGYSPAKFTLATVLLLSGDQASAIAELPKHNLRSETDWHGYRTYLTCMLAGDPSETVRRLEDAERDCVWARQKTRFATILAVAYSKAKKMKEALRILEAGPRLTEAHHKETRLALLGALNAQLGRTQIANTILTRILVTTDPVILKFRAAVLTMRTNNNSVLPLLLAA